MHTNAVRICMEKFGETIFQMVNAGVFSGVGKGIREDFIFCNIYFCIVRTLKS